MKNSVAPKNALSRHAIDAGIVVVAVALLVFAALGNHANVSEMTTVAPIATVGTPPPLQYVQNMTALHSDTPYSLDVIQQEGAAAIVVANRPPVATIQKHRLTTLSGWAVDGPGQRAADAVYVRLDGRVATSCHIGIARDDVAAAYKIPAYATSGFSCSIAADRIVTGRHRLELDIVVQGGHTFYAVVPTTAFVVR